ncbi:MAG: TonB family protein [Bacteroidetes bacterium]|nr:TonB family protein [Bacteroidota bacterium]
MRDWNNDIEKYKKGELTAAEMHALEKQALGDPFLADALEGLDHISSQEFAGDVTQLKSAMQVEKKTTTWIWPLRIAAGVILAVVGGWWFVSQMSKDQTEGELALQKSEELKPVADQPAPISDTIIATPAPNQNQQLALSKPKEVESKTQPLPTETTKNLQGLAVAEKPTIEADKAITEVEVIEMAPVAAHAEAKEEREALPSKDDYKIVSKDAAENKKAAAPAMEPVTALRKTSIGETISGKVVSAEDGTPLPGVNVVVAGTNVGVVTDVNGNYQLQSPVTKPNLSFSFIGLKTKQLQVDGNKADISLETDTAQLSEVVVVGYGAARDENYTPLIKKAEPVGGLKAYNRYLDNDARYPLTELEKKIKGRVSLKFTVKTDGSLDEFKIVKSLGKLFDDEALRMVKEGAAWTPTTEDNVPVESEVLVRVKFDPSKAGR